MITSIFLTITIIAASFIIRSTVLFNAAEEEKITIPVLMYHSVLKDSNYQGEYVISPDDLEKDLIYLKNNGYTTITVSDLIAYVYDDIALPEKPIMLTFDDGYYNNYLYAYPLMQKYEMKMVLSIVAKLTDDYSKSGETNPYYAQVSWNNINEMIASGYVEIQNHSYDLHHQSGIGVGVKKSSSESKTQYKKRILDDMIKSQDMIEQNTGVRPTAFTYPFGFTNDMSTEIVKEAGFTAALLVENKDGEITKNPDSLYEIRRYIRPGKKSTEAYMNKRGL